MTITVGDKLPQATLLRVGANGPEAVDTADLARGRVALFGVPGAFTGTCTNAHMPSFVRTANAFRDKGVDRIVCVTVNDPFVMDAWAKSSDVGDKITMLPDGNGTLTKALGLEMDGTGYSLGHRSKRFAMVIEDGIVKSVNVEEPGAFAVSSADAVLDSI